MTRINLLPTEIKEQIAYSKKNKAFFNIFMGSLFLAILLATFFIYGNSYFKSKLQKTERNIAEQEKSIKGYGTLEKDSKDVYERLNIYKKIDSERVFWSKGLEVIASNTPSSFYLTNINAINDSKTRGVITGNAANKMEIASFMESLRKTGYFKAVDIESVNVIMDPFSARETNNFNLNFTLNLEKLK